MNYVYNLFSKYIRNFMRDHAKLRYKRIKSWPWNLDFDKIYPLRSLFAVRFTKQMTKETFLIYIYESSINRNTKLRYS